MIQGLLSDRLNCEEQKKMKVVNGETVKTSASSSSTTTTVVTNNDQRSLRCPRCDSSNTKFCYYNNYNLTQPRHFCKTCRRYWTQGGALRNIPIGGGCRKGKGITGKVKPAAASEVKPNLGNFQFNPPHHSHLLSLLRSTQNLSIGIGLNEASSGMNLLGQVAVNGFCNPSFKSPHQQQFVLGEIAGDNGVRDIWDRNKQTMNYYLNDHTQGFLSSSASSSFLELASSGMGEMDLWNSSIAWPNIHSAANGAFQ